MPWFKSRISLRDKVHCFKQLAVLTQAALPLARLFDLMQETTTHPRLLAIFASLQQALNNGSRLSDCAALHPQLFNTPSCQFMALGEMSGQLDHTLNALSLSLESQYHYRQQLTQALAYPAFILLSGGLLLLSLLCWVVPRFEVVFQDHTESLPSLTRCLFFIADHLGLLLGTLFPLLAALTYLLIQKARPWLTQDTQLLHCLQALSHGLSAGLPLEISLRLARGFTTSPTLHHAIQHLRQQLHAGTPLAAAMQSHACFPRWIIAFIRTGEESGTLDQRVHQASLTLANLIADRQSLVMQTLQPLILLIQGALIGLVVIGLYLPIFNLGTRF